MRGLGVRFAIVGVLTSITNMVLAQELQITTESIYSAGKNSVLMVRTEKMLSGPDTVYGLGFLEIREVQQELGMSREQVARLREVRQQVAELKNKALREAGGIEALNNDPGALRELERIRRDLDITAADALLNSEQRKRHKQIILQWWGTGVLRRMEVADELGLSSEQRERIAVVYQRYEQKRQVLLETGLKQERKEPPVLVSNAVRLRQLQDPNTPYNVMRREILAVLMPAQKKQWEEMKGPVFKWLAHSRGHDY
jgi:hypothetical protein